jgi:hypothetical protein
VDAIGVKTLADDAGALHELGHGSLLGHDKVSGGNSFLLVKAPDV